ncbi:MAG: DUF4926 domain-containing protein, partial [Chloroflexaceae bacterium]|nr:DUF4926 domain-containing protein [Chloroflexaceae bacterium]
LRLDTDHPIKIPNADRAVIDMGLQRYEDATLLIDIPEEGLAAGDVGAVVERHDVPGLEPGYSVEFFDTLGNTVAVVTVAASALRRPTAAGRPVVRQARVESLV